jgi:hypothetical protein
MAVFADKPVTVILRFSLAIFMRRLIASKAAASSVLRQSRAWN